MGRILAIDYGKKRIGLAVSDPLKMIANALETISPQDFFNFVSSYFSKEKVESIVIGQPKRLHGEDSSIEKDILGFIKKLEKKYPQLKIVRMDERFTSKIAFQTMIDSGIGKKARQNKATIDKISATIILQDYLNTLTH